MQNRHKDLFVTPDHSLDEPMGDHGIVAWVSRDVEERCGKTGRVTMGIAGVNDQLTGS